MKNILKPVKLAGRFVKKNGHTILLIGGITGTVTAGVLACVATYKFDEKTEDSRKEIERVKAEKNTIDNYPAQLTKAYGKFALDITKLYGPSVLLGGFSIASICTSNRILKRRAVESAAAYATLDKSFKTYREAVAEKYGEEAENDIRLGAKIEKEVETVTDENGKKKKIVNKKKSYDLELLKDDPYYLILDKNDWTDFTNNNDYNLKRIAMGMSQLNEQLEHSWLSDDHPGIIFSNQIRESFIMPRIPAGQVIGKVWEKEGDEISYTVDVVMANGLPRCYIIKMELDGIVDNYL